MRATLHAVAADEYAAYAQLARQARLRNLHKAHGHLDLERVEAELRVWLREPRSNAELRERLWELDGMTRDAWTPILFVRTLLPLVQLPPAGAWADRGRAPFVVHDAALPSLEDAAAHVLGRYLAAFGPASLRDAASWAGATQRDFAGAAERLGAVTLRGPDGGKLLDLPGAPLPPGDTPLPVRLLAHWDQPLLAYADRERIMPAEVAPLEADDQRRPHRDGGRPGRRELGVGAQRARRPHHRDPARRAAARRAGGDPRRGEAHGADLRARCAARRGGVRLTALPRRHPDGYLPDRVNQEGEHRCRIGS